MPAESTPLVPGSTDGASTSYSTAPAASSKPTVPNQRSVGIIRAAWYIEDATRGLPPVLRDELVDHDLGWKRDAYLLSEMWSNGIRFPVLIVLYVLCFVELPCIPTKVFTPYFVFNVIAMPVSIILS